MDEEDRRYRSDREEFIDTPVDEELDDFIESPDRVEGTSEEFGGNEEDFRHASERENIPRRDVERPVSHDDDDRQAPLFRSQDSEHFRSRWNSIQATFVDEPRSAVEQADSLVAEVMEQISSMFSEKRSLLDEQWAKHEDVSTEDLRVLLRRYRSFFNRLLSL